MTLLVIATRNAHKVREIQAVLSNGFFYASLMELPGAPPVREDADTFRGNAAKKSISLARWLAATPEAVIKAVQGRDVSKLYCVADDSGLEVDALNKAPGVHSARFAALDSGRAGNSSDEANNAKLLRLMQEVSKEKRTARFRCCIALTPVLLKADARTESPACSAEEFEIQTEIFDGACEGQIDFAPRGKGGFGYDPLFVPCGFSQSFAELGEETKNQISHRSQALQRVKDWFARS